MSTVTGTCGPARFASATAPRRRAATRMPDRNAGTTPRA